jgi:hypothetical protein
MSKHKRTAYALMMSGYSSGPLRADRIYREYATARRDYDVMMRGSGRKGRTESGTRLAIRICKIDAGDWAKLRSEPTAGWAR